jgi:hypothetical protein
MPPPFAPTTPAPPFRCSGGPGGRPASCDGQILDLDTGPAGDFDHAAAGEGAAVVSTVIVVAAARPAVAASMVPSTSTSRRTGAERNF